MWDRVLKVDRKWKMQRQEEFWNDQLFSYNLRYLFYHPTNGLPNLKDIEMPLNCPVARKQLGNSKHNTINFR